MVESLRSGWRRSSGDEVSKQRSPTLIRSEEVEVEETFTPAIRNLMLLNQQVILSGLSALLKVSPMCGSALHDTLERQVLTTRVVLENVIKNKSA